MVKGVLVKTSAQCSCVGRTSLIALSVALSLFFLLLFFLRLFPNYCYLITTETFLVFIL